MLELLPSTIKKVYLFSIVVLIAALLIEILADAFVTSLVSQEFVLAHFADEAAEYFSEEEETELYRLATGTYEEQKDGPLFGAAKAEILS